MPPKGPPGSNRPQTPNNAPHNNPSNRPGGNRNARPGWQGKGPYNNRNRYNSGNRGPGQGRPQQPARPSVPPNPVTTLENRKTKIGDAKRALEQLSAAAEAMRAFLTSKGVKVQIPTTENLFYENDTEFSNEPEVVNYRTARKNFIDKHRGVLASEGLKVADNPLEDSALIWQIENKIKNVDQKIVTEKAKQPDSPENRTKKLVANFESAVGEPMYSETVADDGARDASLAINGTTFEMHTDAGGELSVETKNWNDKEMLPPGYEQVAAKDRDVAEAALRKVYADKINAQLDKYLADYTPFNKEQYVSAAKEKNEAIQMRYGEYLDILEGSGAVKPILERIKEKCAALDPDGLQKIEDYRDIEVDGVRLGAFLGLIKETNTSGNQDEDDNEKLEEECLYLDESIYPPKVVNEKLAQRIEDKINILNKFIESVEAISDADNLEKQITKILKKSIVDDAKKGFVSTPDDFPPQDFDAPPVDKNSPEYLAEVAHIAQAKTRILEEIMNRVTSAEDARRKAAEEAQAEALRAEQERRMAEEIAQEAARDAKINSLVATLESGGEIMPVSFGETYSPTATLTELSIGSIEVSVNQKNPSDIKISNFEERSIIPTGMAQLEAEHGEQVVREALRRAYEKRFTEAMGGFVERHYGNEEVEMGEIESVNAGIEMWEAAWKQQVGPILERIVEAQKKYQEIKNEFKKETEAEIKQALTEQMQERIAIVAEYRKTLVNARSEEEIFAAERNAAKRYENALLTIPHLADTSLPKEFPRYRPTEPTLLETIRNHYGADAGKHLDESARKRSLELVRKGALAAIEGFSFAPVTDPANPPPPIDIELAEEVSADISKRGVDGTGLRLAGEKGAAQIIQMLADRNFRDFKSFKDALEDEIKKLQESKVKKAKIGRPAIEIARIDAEIKSLYSFELAAKKIPQSENFDVGLEQILFTKEERRKKFGDVFLQLRAEINRIGKNVDTTTYLASIDSIENEVRLREENSSSAKDLMFALAIIEEQLPVNQPIIFDGNTIELPALQEKIDALDTQIRALDAAAQKLQRERIPDGSSSSAGGLLGAVNQISDAISYRYNSGKEVNKRLDAKIIEISKNVSSLTREMVRLEGQKTIYIRTTRPMTDTVRDLLYAQHVERVIVQEPDKSPQEDEDGNNKKKKQKKAMVIRGTPKDLFVQINKQLMTISARQLPKSLIEKYDRYKDFKTALAA